MTDFFVPVSLRRRCRSTPLHISSWLMPRAYPSSPLEARFHRFIQIWNLTLSNAVASFIWTQTCQRTSPVAAIQYYLAVRGTTPGPLFVWADGSSFTAPQLISKQLSVHFSLTHGYSRQFFFLQLPQWCRTAAFQFLSSTLLDVGQAMRIVIIFALYPIFFLVRWRVYKGLEVVIGQGITNGYLSPTLITGWR